MILFIGDAQIRQIHEEHAEWRLPGEGRSWELFLLATEFLFVMMKTSWNLIGTMVSQHGELTKCFLSEHYKRSKW